MRKALTFDAIAAVSYIQTCFANTNIIQMCHRWWTTATENTHFHNSYFPLHFVINISVFNSSVDTIASHLRWEETFICERESREENLWTIIMYYMPLRTVSCELCMQYRGRAVRIWCPASNVANGRISHTHESWQTQIHNKESRNIWSFTKNKKTSVWTTITEHKQIYIRNA